MESTSPTNETIGPVGGSSGILDDSAIEFLDALKPQQKSKHLYVVNSAALAHGVRSEVSTFWRQCGIQIEFVDTCITTTYCSGWSLARVQSLAAQVSRELSLQSNSNLLLVLGRFMDPNILGLTPTCSQTGTTFISLFISRFKSGGLPRVLNHEIGHLLGLVHDETSMTLIQDTNWLSSHY